MSHRCINWILSRLFVVVVCFFCRAKNYERNLVTSRNDTWNWTSIWRLFERKSKVQRHWC